MCLVHVHSIVARTNAHTYAHKGVFITELTGLFHEAIGLVSSQEHPQRSSVELTTGSLPSPVLVHHWSVHLSVVSWWLQWTVTCWPKGIMGTGCPVWSGNNHMARTWLDHVTAHWLLDGQPTDPVVSWLTQWGRRSRAKLNMQEGIWGHMRRTDHCFDHHWPGQEPGLWVTSKANSLLQMSNLIKHIVLIQYITFFQFLACYRSQPPYVSQRRISTGASKRTDLMYTRFISR